MILIDDLKSYYDNDMVFATEHASHRFRQRGIRAADIRNVVFYGEIIEQYPDDYPFPSCLILGKGIDGRFIHTVMSDEGSSSRIITAYYPDPDQWSDDFRIRKADNE